MFQVKICGITNVEDARAAAAAGADAIGLNFFAGSPRCVTREQAWEIVCALNGRIRVVGVFVNVSIEEMLETAGELALNFFQLHGDESPELVADLLGMVTAMNEFSKQPPSFVTRMFMKLIPQPPLEHQIIRALRCSGPNLLEVSDCLRQCADAGGLPNAVLLDANQPGQYGGTGQVVDWDVVRNERDKLFGLPVILAGGLTPENVAAAIATARPDAVDTASGVEVSPGRKDHAKMFDFVARVRAAFAQLAAT